jgi:hypothetical protein
MDSVALAAASGSQSRAVLPGMKSTLATLSLVFACCSFIFPPVFVVLAISFGHQAMREFKRYPELEGKGKARWGLIIGYLYLPAFFLGCYVYAYFLMRHPIPHH